MGGNFKSEILAYYYLLFPLYLEKIEGLEKIWSYLL